MCRPSVFGNLCGSRSEAGSILDKLGHGTVANRSGHRSVAGDPEGFWGPGWPKPHGSGFRINFKTWYTLSSKALQIFRFIPGMHPWALAGPTPRAWLAPAPRVWLQNACRNTVHFELQNPPDLQVYSWGAPLGPGWPQPQGP
jgi:hypothetical protein